MTDFTRYRRKQIAELRPWVEGEGLGDISISVEDINAGSPKAGDMIARNPKNHADQWLVAAAYFADNFEPVTQDGKQAEYHRGYSEGVADQIETQRYEASMSPSQECKT